MLRRAAIASHASPHGGDDRAVIELGHGDGVRLKGVVDSVLPAADLLLRIIAGSLKHATRQHAHA
jgi:hypothetical protein